MYRKVNRKNSRPSRFSYLYGYDVSIVLLCTHSHNIVHLYQSDGLSLVAFLRFALSPSLTLEQKIKSICYIITYNLFRIGIGNKADINMLLTHFKIRNICHP
jgi:hypothetical protein